MCQFGERFGDFADQGAASHGDYDVVGKFPGKLFGDFVAVGLRAFGVIGAQVDVHKSPAKFVRDLGAEAVDVIVVAVDADDARAVDGSVQDFRRFEVRGNKDAGVESLVRALSSDGVRQISGGRAADCFKAESACGGECRGHHAILERE